MVLFLSDGQTAIYTAPVDKNGEWQVDHSQNDFRLSEGNHSIVIFSYDEKMGVRSPASATQYFKVTTSLLDILVKNVDVLTNYSIILILIFGVLLTILTI